MTKDLQRKTVAVLTSNNASILKYLRQLQNRQQRARFSPPWTFFARFSFSFQENTSEPCKYRLEIRSRTVISSLPPFFSTARLFSHVRSFVRSPRSVFLTDKFLVDSPSNRGKMVFMMGCLARDNNDNNDANALYCRPRRGERSYTKKSKIRGVPERVERWWLNAKKEDKDEGKVVWGEDGKLANWVIPRPNSSSCSLPERRRKYYFASIGVPLRPLPPPSAPLPTVLFVVNREFEL